MDKPQPTRERIKLALGPFVGSITTTSVKIWLNVETVDADKKVYVTLRMQQQAPRLGREYKSRADIRTMRDSSVAATGIIECPHAHFGTGIIEISDLQPNSKYLYQLWEDEEHSIKLDLDGLKDSELFFWTLPIDGYGRQLDFLLMSCHNPATKKDDGYDGFAVWHQIPSIIHEDQNGNVRFAILTGDQVYADKVEGELLAEKNPRKRQELYLKIYKEFWGNIEYRRVLCRLPAVLMWDDHDITDGWGSREDSFTTPKSSKFKPEWKGLFESGKEMFALMQASRNPEPLFPNFAGGFDTCFTVGKAGFVIADLRSNRNVRKKKIWNPEQLDGIKAWVASHKHELHTLFFVSSVVFSHGAPKIESWILKQWFRVLDVARFAGGVVLLRSPVQWFDRTFGDLRDDINDSWGAEVNAEEADRLLDFLFELENPPDPKDSLNVIILSGDIHTPGYSTIYSSQDGLKKAVIPHIVSTPVAYEPFSWIGEAVFRHLTKVVALGKNGRYTSQVSHHFCYRNVVVVSLRNYEKDESHLKVKYYLEGFPEPQIMLFDLIHGARREAIEWPEPPEKKTWLKRLRSKLKWRKRKRRFGKSAPEPPSASPGFDLPESAPPT